MSQSVGLFRLKFKWGEVKVKMIMQENKILRFHPGKGLLNQIL